MGKTMRRTPFHRMFGEAAPIAPNRRAKERRETRHHVLDCITIVGEDYQPDPIDNDVYEYPDYSDDWYDDYDQRDYDEYPEGYYYPSDEYESGDNTFTQSYSRV